jgi:PIN domain nuclease of toxin-antitoxin system
MNQAVKDLRLTILPITVECADVQSVLEYHHRDPFDRLLVAHAQIEDAALLSSDPVFERYGIRRVW